MSEHSEELDWAASWFQWFSRAAIVLTVLAAIGGVINITQAQSLNATFNRPTMQFLGFLNLVFIIGGGLVTAFVFKVGDIICSFLADFARGLLAQQIARDRTNKS